MENNLIASYAYRGRGTRSIGALDIDWNALLSNIIKSGVDIYTATQMVNAQKAAAAAAAAAGQNYQLPTGYNQYSSGGSISQYMPIILGGAALLVVILLMKRK